MDRTVPPTRPRLGLVLDISHYQMSQTQEQNPETANELKPYQRIKLKSIVSTGLVLGMGRGQPSTIGQAVDPLTPRITMTGGKSLLSILCGHSYVDSTLLTAVLFIHPAPETQTGINIYG